MNFRSTRGDSFSMEDGNRTPCIDLSTSSLNSSVGGEGGGRTSRAESDVSLYVDLTKTGDDVAVCRGGFPASDTTIYIDMTTLNLTLAATLKTLRKGGRRATRGAPAADDHSHTDGSEKHHHDLRQGSRRDLVVGHRHQQERQEDGEEVATYDDRVGFGYLMCAAARSPFAVLMVNFVAPVILQEAQNAAAANGGQFGGFKASNIFSVLYFIFAILVILLGPPLGALADYTKHRKTLLSALLLLMNTSCLFLLITGSSPDAWVGVCALLVLTLLAAELVGVPILAYLPEVTSDHAKSTALASMSTVVFVVVCLVFAGVSIAMGSALHLDDASRVRAACIIAVLFSLPFTAVAIYKMPAREPSQAWPTSSSSSSSSQAGPFMAGFGVLVRKAKDLWASHPSIARFIIARAFYQAGQRSLAALATTYLVIQLAMSPSGVTMVMSLAFLCGIPGALVSMCLGHRLRGVGPLLLVLTLMGVSVGVCPLVLADAASNRYAVVFSVIWGMAVGFAGSYDQALFAGLIPEGKEAELSGLFVFSNSALEWLPPLLFSLANQWAASLRWALASLVIFYVVALAILLTVNTARPATAAEVAAMAERLKGLAMLTTTTQNGAGGPVVAGSSSRRGTATAGSIITSVGGVPLTQQQQQQAAARQLGQHKDGREGGADEDQEGEEEEVASPGDLGLRVGKHGEVVQERLFPDMLSPIIESPAAISTTSNNNHHNNNTDTSVSGTGEGGSSRDR